MAGDLLTRIQELAELIFDSKKLVVFTGAGISTSSGIPDFRGPDGIWTRKSKGLEINNFDWSVSEPNAGHKAVFELQELGKLYFLISQNVDNMHLKSGIKPELIAELHGNITKLRCVNCGFIMDNFDDGMDCPVCGGKMKSSVINFGDPLPVKTFETAVKYASECDLLLSAGSSLVVHPAADIPQIALESGAGLVIINNQPTPYDEKAVMLFRENIDYILPEAVKNLRKYMNSSNNL
jgi:NAD-dependent deacetylase